MRSKKVYKMILSIVLVLCMTGGLIPAKAAVSTWSILIDGEQAVAVGETITLDAGQKVNVSLCKNKKLVDKANKTYSVAWESTNANAVWVDVDTGLLVADKDGTLRDGIVTIKVNAVISNMKEETSTKRGFTVKVVKESVAQSSGLIKVDNQSGKTGDTITGSKNGLKNSNNGFYVGEAVKASDLPYYVGRQDASFIEKNKGKYDVIAYIGTPLYIPNSYPDGTYFEIADNSIIHIEGKEIIPTKQGVTKLKVYDANKKLLQEQRVLVTTFNDGKDVINTCNFDLEFSLWSYNDMRSGEHWKNMVKTIADVSFCLQARQFIYDSQGECQLPFAGEWQWTMYGEDLILQSKGVCLQAAQTACYLLAGDFEDWGLIYVFGNQGHVFNYFYEDGYFYIMDFTDVIGDNAGRNGDFRSYMDYSNRVKKFKTIDEIKKWITTEKVDTTKNYIVTMYSCQGHDYLPAWSDTGCHDTRGVMAGNVTAEMQWEKIVFEHDSFEILYQNPKCKVKLSGADIKDMPLLLQLCDHTLYTPINEDIKWYYEY